MKSLQTGDMRAHPHIQGITGISQLVMRLPTYGSPFAIACFPSDERFFWTRYAVDYDFTDTYDVDIVAGRDFSADIPTDLTLFTQYGRHAGRACRVNKSSAGAQV